MFDGFLRAPSEMFTGSSHVFAKMFATAHYAAVFNIVAHAPAGPANLCAALLHLSLGSVAILLSNAV
jgi:hypothetical protein